MKSISTRHPTKAPLENRNAEQLSSLPRQVQTPERTLKSLVFILLEQVALFMKIEDKGSYL